MKTVTVGELHDATWNYAQEALRNPILITERGEPVAILKKADVPAQTGKPLPNREAWISRLPQSELDSTQIISEDRHRDDLPLS